MKLLITYTYPSGSVATKTVQCDTLRTIDGPYDSLIAWSKDGVAVDAVAFSGGITRVDIEAV